MNDLSTPLTDVEYEELDDFLLSVEHDDAVLNLSEFDGFITAVVSGQKTIMPSTWMPALWGGEDNAPVWQSLEDYQFIFGLMIRHMNMTSATLMADPIEFEPMFMESTIDGVTHWVVDEWCTGYMKGVALYPISAVTISDMNEMLAPIRQFADPDGWDSLKGKDHREIRELQEQIAPAARAIHAYWLARRTTPDAEAGTYVRPEPKVGRNDPCPCGSGIKFKKCCGTH
ncbi:MAG: UPF0149 family protein [Woeseia sp.]